MLLALDRKEREREMVSQLLAALHPKTLSEAALGQGFTELLLACEARRAPPFAPLPAALDSLGNSPATHLPLSFVLPHFLAN